AKIDFQPQTETKTELEKTADLLGVAPEPLRARPAPTAHGFDTSIPTGPDVGQQVRAEKPPLPRGERRTQVRTPEEIQTQELFGEARKELGEDATSDQVMARVEELKKEEANRGTAQGKQGQGTRAAEQAAGVSRPESANQLSDSGPPRTPVDAREGKGGEERALEPVGAKGTHYILLSATGAPTLKVPIDYADHASQVMQAYRDRFNLGSSDMGSNAGQIFTKEGQQIGYISYNGRVWEGTPQTWKSGQKPLQERTPL